MEESAEPEVEHAVLVVDVLRFSRINESLGAIGNVLTVGQTLLDKTVSNFVEAAAFHEGFGDVIAIMYALSDQQTRQQRKAQKRAEAEASRLRNKAVKSELKTRVKNTVKAAETGAETAQ